MYRRTQYIEGWVISSLRHLLGAWGRVPCGEGDPVSAGEEGQTRLPRTGEGYVVSPANSKS